MSLSVDIKKDFPGFQLAVSFEAGDEIIGLLGPSGGGKSMTLRCIAGIETPDSGKIILNGTTLFDSAQGINLSPQKRNTGYMFQNYALFPNFTVWENIAAGLRQKTKEEQHAIVARQIALLQLDGLEKRYPAQLSGGQQQRVALARILAYDPAILMLDEPFSALDSYLRYSLEEEFGNILAAYQGTVLYVSHSNDEIYRYCREAAVLYNGKIENIMEKECLFHAPQTLQAAQITGCRNISPVSVKDGYLYAESWGLAFPLTLFTLSHQTVNYVGIREESVQLSRESGGDFSFPVTVESHYPVPGEPLVYVSHKQGATILCRHREAKDNETWYCHIDPVDLLLLS